MARRKKTVLDDFVENMDIVIQTIKKQNEIISIIDKETNDWNGSDYKIAFEDIRKIIEE